MPEESDKKKLLHQADELIRNTRILKKKCQIIWFKQTLHFSVVSASLFSMPFFRDKIMENSNLIFTALLISTLFFFIQYFLITSIKKAKITYRNCNFLSASISDDVDWKMLRKRQLYTHLYPRIQQSLDDYFIFCSSHLCIFEGGKRRFRNLLLANRIQMMAVAVYVLIIIIGIILG